jgi:hypothetical protein
MADQAKISGMLEHLINDEQEKAEELFHEYIVEKSREIYEGLIETELDEASDEDEDEDEDLEENFDEVEENFEDLEVIEADDETDDLVSDIEDSEEGEEDEEGEESEDLSDEEQTDRILDLEDQLASLEAEFARMKEEEAGEPYHSKEMTDDFELETVREYVEKVATPKGGDHGANAKSVVAGKNDMGGTAANIVTGGAEEKGGKAAAPKEDNAGNINVPGGKAGDAFKKNSAGHGAEKKGTAEQADNKQSLFRK